MLLVCFIPTTGWRAKERTSPKDGENGERGRIKNKNKPARLMTHPLTQQLAKRASTLTVLEKFENIYEN